MLTAQTKSGKNICLGFNYNKESLLKLRGKEDFFCPICGEKVLLKLGEQRIFHFAHLQEGACRDFFENESVYHMEGKQQLYQWLLKQKIPAALEFYDREIQQRPDIMFQYNGKKYALEYQCSSIPERIFTKRTKTYIQNDYIPIWLIANNQMHIKKKNIVALSNFQYLFLCPSLSGKFYIPSYCPDHHQFHFFESITPYSIKNAFANHSIYSLDKLDIQDLLEPKRCSPFNLASWNREIEKNKLNWALHPSHQHKSFFQEIYSNYLNLFLLPPVIGLPVPHAVLIQTSPIIWQTYLYLDIIASKRTNDLITLQEINFHFKKRHHRKEIVLRKLPQFDQSTPLTAFIEYLLLLEILGIISRTDETTFQVNRTIIIPKSNREREEANAIFIKKNQQILSFNK